MGILSLLKKFNIYRVIKNLFKKSSDKEDNNNPENTDLTGSIVFDIIDNKDISIKCYFPDIEKLDDENILDYAESYGRLLSNITDGIYAQKIADILISNSSKDDPKMVLFVNNIIAFWSSFHIENNKIAIKNSNQPLVRPSRVFKRP
jgi:hypothetical protein